MKIPPLIGLLGVLIAVISAQLNSVAVSTAAVDIAGAAGIGNDVSRWLPTVYVVGEVSGMAVSSTLAVIFGLRRFTLFVIGLVLLPTLAIPLCGSAGALLACRLLQGVAGGLTIPLLMTTALRVLAPPIRLFGLAAYALSATFAPNLATSLAALWTDGAESTAFLFLQAIPFAALAGVLVWWGAEEVPPKYEMLRKFDWPGLLLVAIGFGSLAIVLEQGDQLDWFNSTVICILTLTAALAVPLLIARELTAPQPLFMLSLLLRRNFAYGVTTLIFLLVVLSGSAQVPLAFLEQVQGYRPLQAHILTLEFALGQLLFLPLTALLLDHRHVDARWVSFAGLSLIAVAYLSTARLDSSWNRDQFYVWQAVQSLGTAFVVLPLLMMATNAITDPREGPFAAGLVNAPRAMAEAVGVWVTELVTRWRGGLHRDQIAEIIGRQGPAVAQAMSAPGGGGQAGSASGGGAALNAAVEAQVTTLTTIDTFLVLAMLVGVVMLILAVLPVRTYPPRIALAKH